LSTVRIYKVAELLGLQSQEAMTLLKKETGIDVKSASSSIEEIVARQFVERQARKRNIALPPGPLFADASVAKKPGKAAPEPPKPSAPALRPRLIKTIKPPTPVEAAPDVEATTAIEEPLEHAAPVVEAPHPDVDTPVEAAAATPAATPAAPIETGAATPPLPAPEAPRAAPRAAAAPPAPPPSVAPAPIAARSVSRLVPPTRRLRIEDPLTG
jgi:translation initiation factor IF-2-like protein